MRMLVLLLGILAAGLLTACSDGGGGGGDTTTKVEKGWTAFLDGDLDEAQDQFESALADDPTNAEAHNGLGWVHTRRGNLDEAVNSFDAALDNGHTGADPHAGKAIVLRDREPLDLAGAVAAATAALTADSDWQFAYDATLDWRDMRLILAHAHYGLGAYDLAYDQVRALGGATLDPAASDFPRQLLREIERLTVLYGGA